MLLALVFIIKETIRPYKPKTSAKIRIKTIETYNLFDVGKNKNKKHICKLEIPNFKNTKLSHKK